MGRPGSFTQLEIITEGAPGYGNNDAYVDDLARWAAGVYCKLTEECSGPRGPYSPGLYPVVAHIYMGYWLGASLDGRKACEPLADGISPCTAIKTKTWPDSYNAQFCRGCGPSHLLQRHLAESKSSTQTAVEGDSVHKKSNISN